jgi:hypothetical protein
VSVPVVVFSKLQLVANSVQGVTILTGGYHRPKAPLLYPGAVQTHQVQATIAVLSRFQNVDVRMHRRYQDDTRFFSTLVEKLDIATVRTVRVVTWTGSMPQGLFSGVTVRPTSPTHDGFITTSPRHGHRRFQGHPVSSSVFNPPVTARSHLLFNARPYSFL